jgi:hypothetical protein
MTELPKDAATALVSKFFGTEISCQLPEDAPGTLRVDTVRPEAPHAAPTDSAPQGCAGRGCVNYQNVVARLDAATNRAGRLDARLGSLHDDCQAALRRAEKAESVAGELGAGYQKACKERAAADTRFQDLEAVYKNGFWGRAAAHAVEQAKEAEKQRDMAWAELRAIREAVKADPEESTLDVVEALVRKIPEREQWERVAKNEAARAVTAENARDDFKERLRAEATRGAKERDLLRKQVRTVGDELDVAERQGWEDKKKIAVLVKWNEQDKRARRRAQKLARKRNRGRK